MSIKGQVIRAKTSGNIFLRIGLFRIVCQKNNYFVNFFSQGDTRSCHWSDIRARTSSEVFFCCSVWLFCTSRLKMNTICIVLPLIFSKNLFWPVFVDFPPNEIIWLRHFVPILRSCNFMPSFGKILWPVLEKSCGQSNRWTNERTWIYLLCQWTQKYGLIYKNSLYQAW